MSEKVTGLAEYQTSDIQMKGFKAYEVETRVHPIPIYGRRDFYKVCLSTGHTILNYGDRTIEIDGTFLFFGNPHIPYSSHIQSELMTGYACLFSEEFLKLYHRQGTQHELPLLRLANSPVVAVDEQQTAFLIMIFQKIIAEQESDYTNKDDLVRSYLHLIIQEALKMNPQDHLVKYKNAASRVAFLFLELLERQFPVENTNEPLKIRTAQEFAQHLNVHVNYLNKSVKEVTGKPTTVHIAERIAAEAKALLQHTEWSIAEIAYALGFEYPTYFNNHFKKVTGAIPKSFRAK
ncbi:helix-turn-helix domain-containing protein [Flavobacterium sandaracinum]|uniref:AraC family transcriptional regulator n=1 Tax=Flavobacterium sandaracinum TaxID=2541733 RepID=A0A4R5CSR3_9FLAO|nr:helix-turn-helix domain-containing protein [Flavobacterium sandaracinum]TDE00835.1 AraC family transcriptional regulator [Flavobacterium sandaracinum]